MCNFNKQTQETKEFIALFMQKATEYLGGANFFLSLIEALRADKPHPLLNKRCRIASQQAQISWNKVIFKDKFDVLQEIVLQHKSSEDVNFNILDIASQKMKKKSINMTKTLAPIKFKVHTLESHSGFEFEIFEKIDFENDYVTINPIFTALFFCSTDYTKRALKYKG